MIGVVKGPTGLSPVHELDSWIKKHSPITFYFNKKRRRKGL